ncbi:MAG: family 10 glycosylhydrolase [Verrucomicrobia bacterium]|nr:family 10 glycosylhydrolase [Verrucomicrobiota bacterium]
MAASTSTTRRFSHDTEGSFRFCHLPVDSGDCFLPAQAAENQFKLVDEGTSMKSTDGGLIASGRTPAPVGASSGQSTHGKPQLSGDHLAAVNRRRRIVVNYDTGFGDPEHINHHFAGLDMRQIVEAYFSVIDAKDVQIDSVWWCWLDGNYANYSSKILPVWEAPLFTKWWQKGIDPVKVFAEETQKRGLEAFFSYRLNGTDTAGIQPLSKPLLKKAHPEWLIHTWETNVNPGYWNFAFKEVRDYKLSILREVAENYNYDGIEIDFARTPINLPPGHQWENRIYLTEFMRAVRFMTLEVEKNRRRPFLLAARIPENIVGCHFDGNDVETWASEQLVDLFVLGNRSFEVDIAGFRRIVQGTAIKLYPCLDDHHATDGYEHPPIEVFRGVFANWWKEGADGIQTFNFTNMTGAGFASLGYPEASPSRLHLQAYQEMARPEDLKHKDKTFVVQRRGGGHGPPVVPDPNAWHTPRWMYFLTNMFAPLPATLANDGEADTLLAVYVADDVASDADRIKQIALRVLLSDPEAKSLPASERLEQVTMASHDYPGGKRPNIPPARGIENAIELRINNILLAQPVVEEGWLLFKAQPNQFAVGNNLVELRIIHRDPGTGSEIRIEMIEVMVKYR